jgi:hypothetical protein
MEVEKNRIVSMGGVSVVPMSVDEIVSSWPMQFGQDISHNQCVLRIF